MIEPAFLKVEDVAALFGWSKDHFWARRPVLIEAGFPAPDPLVRKYLRADVEAWIEGRSQLAGDATPREPSIDFDAL